VVEHAADGDLDVEVVANVEAVAARLGAHHSLSGLQVNFDDHGFTVRHCHLVEENISPHEEFAAGAFKGYAVELRIFTPVYKSDFRDFIPLVFFD
jgi:hypothetical protein